MLSGIYFNDIGWAEIHWVNTENRSLITVATVRMAWGGIDPPTQALSTRIDLFGLVVFQQSSSGR